jgi:hypothetical protein
MDMKSMREDLCSVGEGERGRGILLHLGGVGGEVEDDILHTAQGQTLKIREP